MYSKRHASDARLSNYSKEVAERFKRGESPSDFPKGDYEVDWANRFSVDELNEIGARGLGIQRRGRVVAARAATVD